MNETRFDWADYLEGSGFKITESIPAPPKRSSLRSFGLREFTLATFPVRDHVLVPIIPVGGTAMVFGQRGGGKTHVAIGISYAAATGTSFLRWRAPVPRRVFHVDGEMPGAALQERFEAVIAGADAIPPTDDHLRLLPMDAQELGASINLAREPDQKMLEAMLDGYDLLVLDNISTLINGGRENDAKSWDSVQAWLLRLRRRGMSVLLIHHAGRSDNARGTSKREDILDTIVHLKRPADYAPDQGARFEVHLTKARGVFGDEARPFEARMEIRNGATVWTTRDLVDVEADQVATMTAEGLSVRDIAEEIGISKSTVSRLQRRLREEGRRA